ncbi:MAG: hypothetical protein K5923_04230 [Clostridia bacterium]|nr:hypothetical protein [Clostridia bacterium]
MNLKRFLTIILVLILSIAFVGCKDNQGVSDGLIVKRGGNARGLCIGYKADVREFDIDNVEIELYYGWNPICELDKNYEDLTYSLIIECMGDPNKSVVKTIEHFNSIEYVCHPPYKGKIKYNHSEKIIIPEALFAGESGEILIYLLAEPSETTSQIEGGYISIVYTKIEGNRIRLDEWATKHGAN